jgi:hypothetical protein
VSFFGPDPCSIHYAVHSECLGRKGTKRRARASGTELASLVGSVRFMRRAWRFDRQPQSAIRIRSSRALKAGNGNGRSGGG